MFWNLATFFSGLLVGVGTVLTLTVDPVNVLFVLVAAGVAAWAVVSARDELRDARTTLTQLEALEGKIRKIRERLPESEVKS